MIICIIADINLKYLTIQNLLNQMINSDRSNQKHSDVSKELFLSDRNMQKDQEKYIRSGMIVQNDEVESQKSKQQIKFYEQPKGRLRIIQSLANPITAELLLRGRKLCQICEYAYELDKLKKFGSCNHSFCYSCLKEYVNFRINNLQSIACPSQLCEKKLDQQSQVYTQIMTGEDRAKYKKIELQLKVLSNPNIRLCKKQNCQGMIDLQVWKQQIQTNNQSPINCPSCNLQYCRECLEEKHQGTCEKNIIKFLQRNKKFRQCSVCKRVIEKTQGCTHMTCLCGNYFCYMCGQGLSNLEIHECNIPNHLNCLQKIRWQIEHMEMFYESNLLSFHRCLYCFELPGKIPTPLRFLYSFAYFLSVYPISIALSLVLIVFFFAFCLLVVTLLFLFLPLSEICTHKDYRITIFLNRYLGCLGFTLCVIIFYPIFVLVIMAESIYGVCKNEDTWEEVGILFKEIGTGLRNVLLMPFVLCVNPDSLDAAQERLNERIQNGV